MLDAFGDFPNPIKSIGLTINNEKCMLWHQSKSTTISTPIAVSSIVDAPSPLVVLGHSVAGSRRALAEFASAVVVKASSAINPFANLTHAQAELLILRCCEPTSRIRHRFWLTKVDEMLEALYTANEENFRQLVKIIGKYPPPGWRFCATTPVKMEGFGFKMLKNIDHRAECVCARSVIEATVQEAALTDEQEQLKAWLYFNTLYHAFAKPLPIKHRGRLQPQQPLFKQIKFLHDTFALNTHFRFLWHC